MTSGNYDREKQMWLSMQKEMLRNGFAKVSKIHFNLEHPLAASLFSMSIDFLVIFF